MKSKAPGPAARHAFTRSFVCFVRSFGYSSVHSCIPSLTHLHITHVSSPRVTFVYVHPEYLPVRRPGVAFSVPPMLCVGVLRIRLSSKTVSQGLRQQCGSAERHTKRLYSAKLNRIRWLEMTHYTRVPSVVPAAKLKPMAAGQVRPALVLGPSLTSIPVMSRKACLKSMGPAHMHRQTSAM